MTAFTDVKQVSFKRENISRFFHIYKDKQEILSENSKFIWVKIGFIGKIKIVSISRYRDFLHYPELKEKSDINILLSDGKFKPDFHASNHFVKIFTKVCL